MEELYAKPDQLQEAGTVRITRYEEDRLDTREITIRSTIPDREVFLLVQENPADGETTVTHMTPGETSRIGGWTPCVTSPG